MADRIIYVDRQTTKTVRPPPKVVYIERNTTSSRGSSGGSSSKSTADDPSIGCLIMFGLLVLGGCFLLLTAGIGGWVDTIVYCFAVFILLGTAGAIADASGK